MTESELRRKLSVLKTAEVPAGYWEGYWGRLSGRLGEVRQALAAREETPWASLVFRVAVPSFAALALGLAGYGLGRRHAPSLANSNLILASESGEPQAQRVFKEMLGLFPNRVNWISFMDGKVDFSISSVAYPESKELVPLVVTLPRAKEAYEARFLIRPGQSASVDAPWDRSTPAFVQVALSQDASHVKLTCRLNGTAGIETEVAVDKDGTQPLGSFRWGERLVQVQLARPPAKPRGPIADKARI